MWLTLSDVGKIMEHVQTKEPDTLQYQIVTNSDKPNEIVVFEEVRSIVPE
jgi:quinol monooxygenase YgiN